MIDLAHEDTDSRLVNYLLKSPVLDGGQYVLKEWYFSPFFLTLRI